MSGPEVIWQGGLAGDRTAKIRIVVVAHKDVRVEVCAARDAMGADIWQPISRDLERHVMSTLAQAIVTMRQQSGQS